MRIDSIIFSNAIVIMDNMSGTIDVDRPVEDKIKGRYCGHDTKMSLYDALVDLIEETPEVPDGVPLFWRGVHRVAEFLNGAGNLVLRDKIYHSVRRIALELLQMGHAWVTLQMVAEAQTLVARRN